MSRLLIVRLLSVLLALLAGPSLLAVPPGAGGEADPPDAVEGEGAEGEGEAEAEAEAEKAPVPLFPDKPGANPAGWTVRQWGNIKEAAPADDPAWQWKVDESGVLHGPGGDADGTGSWLVSDRQYADFVLDFEFKIPPQGNSGCGLRIPLRGDPAIDGFEAQMVDRRYYGERKVNPIELTGSLYKLVPPKQDAFKPGQWNRYQITCKGPLLRMVLNGKTVIDINLDRQIKKPERGKPAKDRPRRGRIGFQDISKHGHVQIRNATIVVLDEPPAEEQR